jgi:Protein of unknown function (DUF3533)
MKFYHRATERRLSPKDPNVRPRRRKFLKAAFLNFILLQILFFALFAYIFGSLYQQNGHTHNLSVLFVDYDAGGSITQAIRQSYSKVQTDSFPMLIERPALEFPDPPTSLRDEVCRARYWAALYVSPGASNRLQDALTGGSAATSYNRSDALVFIWNEARYSAVVDSSISSNLQTLSSSAKVAWANLMAPNISQSLSLQDPTLITTVLDPWTLTSVNIQPTTQGSRLVYNTLVIILILIQEFFYLGTINGLYAQFKLFLSLHPTRIIVYRNCISLAYTLIGSLCVTGIIWAFRAGWHVNGNQFALNWMALWLFAHSNFLVLDVCTVWFPAPYIPMALITWVVLNVTSILLPFELSPAFYRWGYAMPAHEVYQTLTDIWSGGCNPQIRYALPILFSWEVVGLVLTAVGVYRRCHYAVIAEEQQEAAFQDRLNAAMAYERRHDRKRRESAVMRGAEPETIEEEKEEEKEEEEELGEVIREEDRKIERRGSVAVENLCFPLAFPPDRGQQDWAPLRRFATAPARRR